MDSAWSGPDHVPAYQPTLSAETSFLVLNANRNVPRKRMDATLRVFADFARDKPKGVKLLLKSAGPGVYGYDIEKIVRTLGLDGRVLVTGALRLADTLSDEDMNLLYNASDVGLNTSEGEGWGLIALEHAAAGAPQILPAHPVAADMWAGYAGLARTVGKRFDRGDLFLYDEVDEGEARNVLERLYRDEVFRNSATLEARWIAERPELEWVEVGKAWKDVVCGVNRMRPPYS
jgi:D-inositol-3-phosphate glycosyltransferase